MNILFRYSVVIFKKCKQEEQNYLEYSRTHQKSGTTGLMKAEMFKLN